MKSKKKLRLKISKFTVFIFFLDLLVISGLVMIQNYQFKSFWIPTAMTTMSHKYLAYTLYNEDTVDKVMSENYVEQTSEEINLDDIIISDGSKRHYSNKYEKELFTKDPGNDVYKTIRINETKYKGWLIGIYDPADVDLAVSSKLGKAGQSVNKLVTTNDGLVGING